MFVFILHDKLGKMCTFLFTLMTGEGVTEKLCESDMHFPHAMCSINERIMHHNICKRKLLSTELTFLIDF